jgi:hypothetical protein
MRSLILAAFSVAALLSVNSGVVLAQGTPTNPGPVPNSGPTPSASPVPNGGCQGDLCGLTPTPNPSPTPSPGPKPTIGLTPGPEPASQSSSEESPRAYPEAGRYHPCPASVGFPDGRTVCLGLDNERRRPRHVARRVAGWGCGCCCRYYW